MDRWSRTSELPPLDFVHDALGLVARASGMGQIAKKAGLNRKRLYKALGGPVVPNRHSHAVLFAPWA